MFFKKRKKVTKKERNLDEISAMGGANGVAGITGDVEGYSLPLGSKKKKLKKDLVKKVIEDSPVRINQTAAETAAERYDSVVTINNSIKEQDTIIEYLEKVEKILSTMHWEVKNIVDINRMEQL